MAVADEVNLVLLIELAAVVIATSAFLFYWNRLLGSVISLLIRLYTWRYCNAYVVIGSLQISPLAGRISFRDVEYHSSNISVRALHGNVTWRYWKLRVRQEDETGSSNPKRNKLPCRISVFAEGVEGFVYNRTPAYDAIVERMKKHEGEEKTSQDGTTKQSSRSSEDTTANPNRTLRSRLKKVVKTSTRGSSTKRSENSHNLQDDLPGVDHELPAQVKPVTQPPVNGVNWLREALPLAIRIGSGSFVLGSDATPMVLIADFKKAEGMVEITDARSALDLYKTAADITFNHASVLMRTNVDHSGPLLAHGKKVYDELLKRQPDLAHRPPSTLSVLTGFHLLAKHFKFLYDPKFSTPPVAGLPTDKVWKGLARYREHDSAETKPPKREEREYAKVTNLLETHRLDLTYYADTPGPVPQPSDFPDIDAHDAVGNVDLPPEYGIDIVVHKANVKYGPWADQQRDAIQRAFAPSLFFDSEPKARLQPGETRVHTTLVFHLLFEDETVMRIPTREPSKDWQFDNAPVDLERRYGWLDVVVGPNSSISYTQDQIATRQGYNSMLVLQLDSLAISSSVNLDTFIKAKSCRRDWGMDVTLDAPSISLLRDHVTLISDLAKDWSSGATVGDYHHFVPNHYNFRVSLVNYAFHLYINDYNIVDAPWSRDSNAFMDLYGPRMNAFVAVASTQYRPESSVVPFSVDVPDARVELCVPKWDTHRAFGESVTEVGKIGHLHAQGSYLYYSMPQPDHQETLNLHLEGKRVVFKALGWALRRLFCVKDNYFGGFTQFRTMQEYLERFDHDPKSVGDPVEEKYRPGRSDPFAVNVTMNVEESLVLMSDEIYNCMRGVVIPVPQLQMNLKSVDHFMELSLDATPTYVAVAESLDDVFRNGSAPSISSKDAVFIEGIEIKANRLFGPQPHATTYLCLWEVSIPNLHAFLSPDLILTLMAVGRAVGYTFSDPDNSPAQIYVPTSPPDVTFFKFSLDEGTVMLMTGDKALSIQTHKGISLDTSTCGTRSHSSMLGVLLPSVTMTVLAQDGKRTWQPVGSANVGASIDIYKAPTGWRDRVAEQQEFLKEEDGPTGRIWFMYQKVEPARGHHADGLYLPQPMQREHDDISGDSESDISVSGSDHEFLQSSSASSNESEADTAPNPSTIPRTARRARSFATASETPDTSSFDDESDSSTCDTTREGSFASEVEQQFTDMATCLATRLKSFRLANHTPPVVGNKDPTIVKMDSSPAHPGRVIDSGTIFRICGQDMVVDLTPQAVEVIFGIMTALSLKHDGHEKRLDALLASQVDHIETSLQNVEPKVVAVRFPRVRLRLLAGKGPGPSLETEACDITCDLYHFAPPHQRTVLDVNSSISSINVVGSSLFVEPSGISLRDVSTVDIDPQQDAPVLKLSMEKLDASIHQSQGLRTRIQLPKFEIDIVTSASALVTSLVKPWESALRNIRNEQPAATAPDAQMLYTILKTAAESGQATYLPGFAYERAYGLHVQDSRNIRTQTGWWLLARFRDWHRRMPSNILAKETSIEKMADYVISQLCRVEDTVNGAENVVREQHFIKSVFGSRVLPPSPKLKPDKAMDLFCYTDKLQISHHGRLLGSSSLATSSFQIEKASVGGSSLSGKLDDRPSSQVRILIAASKLKTQIHDSLFAMVQPVLRAIPVASTDPNSSARTEDRASVIVASGQFGEIDADVLAAGLRVSYRSQQLQMSHIGRTLMRSDQKPSQKSSKEIMFATCASAELSILQTSDDQSVLDRSADRVIISLKIAGAKTRLERLERTASPVDIRVVAGVKAVEIDSRPQLKAFYSFVQAWKEKELPLYASTFDELKALLNKPNDAPPSATTFVPPSVHVASIDVSIGIIQLQVRAAKTLWLRWDVGKLYASRQSESDISQFALHVAPQIVGAHNSVRKANPSDSSVLRLPSITVVGTHQCIEGRPHLVANIEMGLFTGVLKPVVLDRLLSLHQRVAADFTQFVQDWQADATKALSKRHTKGISMISMEPKSTMPEPPMGMLFDVHLGVTGIRFGLRADNVATTLLFEALAIEGRATNLRNEQDALHWRVKVDHFGLSLGHLGLQSLSEETGLMSKHRTAYMVFDAEAHEIPATAKSTSKLNVNLSRVHTVMHPQALSELADLLKSWTSDLHVLHEHRAAEVKEVKRHTSRVLKRLESAERVEHSDISWFANRLVCVEVSGIGVAIPLVEGTSIGGGGRSEVPALLYTIRVISFQNRRNETARFKVQNMALQFVTGFDQSSPEHFTADFHESVNCMTLPAIESEAQMSSTADEWQLSAHWSATDFKLSLSPDIVDVIFRLIDLFEHGKDRIAKLEEHYRSEMAKHPENSVAAKYDDPTTPVSVRIAQRILVKMSFTFNSGIVELHRDLSESERRTMNADVKKSRNWHDTVVLPTVSLWMDHVGPRANLMPSDSNRDSALLLFNAAVHESRNLLRPTILPFFVQAVNRMERRARHKHQQIAATASPGPTASSTPMSDIGHTTTTPTSSRASVDKVRLRVTLRIDKSRLRLSCAPDSNAYVDLKWESGGFMASTTIGGQDPTTVAGNVSGVTAYLRHEFAEEGQSCIEAGAKDMAFTIAYCPDNATGQKGLSIVLDTQLSAQFRLEQFSAWLTFAAVWIESAPPLDLPPKSAIVEAATATPTPVTGQPHPRLCIAALIRFRSIEFDANVGVTNATLNFTPIVLRTLSNGEQTKLDFDIGVTKLTAKGDLSGVLRSESLRFHTVRQSSRSGTQAAATVLSMTIEAGDLTGDLFMQDMAVMKFHLEPANVRLADDWRAFNANHGSQVSLAFTVKTGVFRAVTRLLAIPTLLNKMYSISNMVESQERMASHRSSTFKATKLRRSTEPSPMAAAILQTARKAGQNMASAENIKTAQTMRFDLGGVDIGVFNAPITEDTRGDFYRFMVGKFEADLRRRLTKDGLSKRDLSLLVSFVSWDTSDGSRAAKDAAMDWAVKDVIESASKHNRREIAWLPLMTMNMNSIEEPRPPTLVYDFDLVWGEGDGDIAILPNFFQQAYETFNAFSQGLDHEQVTKAKRRGEDNSIRNKGKTGDKDEEKDKDNVKRTEGHEGKEQKKDRADLEETKDKETLIFRSRLDGRRSLPVPRLRLLGKGTQQAMEAIPRINKFSEQLPIFIHKGVTAPLEDGMDLLLKLYEKQLPDRAT